MAHQYDVIVIGSGPAGGTVAAGCQKAGLRVAVIESQGYGGTCPLREGVWSYPSSVYNIQNLI